MFNLTNPPPQQQQFLPQPRQDCLGDLQSSVETVEDNLSELPSRPVYAAPSLMSVRSCFAMPSSGQWPHNVFFPHAAAFAQSQPQLSHSYSQPFLGRVSNSADHLVSASLNQLNSSSVIEDGNATVHTLPFHEHVKNSAHKLPVINQKSITAVCNDTGDVNVVGTAVRIQVSAVCFHCFFLVYTHF